ncbi:hypothetical protein [Novosphingobium sp.]|uniref:hypothetical protein n=1 Tax=Novosphingobium sp. TaxID=1874826 RepID=UPI001D44E69A|nr:hypothetical protein [Novosphingobium sp.]MBX9663052.1 hypothetical protein [Novosphingobium sp.]
MNQPIDSRPLTAAETDALRARQRERNKVMGLILGFLVILFFAISIVKITAKPEHKGTEGAEQVEHS